MDRKNERVGRPPADLTEVVRLRGWCIPRSIGYLNSIIDAYEGLAAVRTIDAKSGEVEFWVTRKESHLLESVLAELSKVIPLKMEGDHVTRKADSGVGR